MPPGDRPTPATRQCKLTYTGSFQDARWANVMWLFFTGSGEITHADLAAVADDCGDAYGTHFMPKLSVDSVLEKVELTLYSAGEPFSVTRDVNTAGVVTDAVADAGASACISWQIAPSYRGGHPRTYLCGLTVTRFFTTTTLTNAFVAALALSAVAFHTDIEAISSGGSGISSVEHGVVSFARANAWRTPPVFYRIQDATVDNRIDHQRRRVGRDR